MHLSKGMLKRIEVVPAEQRADPPASTAEIRLADHAFTLTTPLAAGPQVITIVNDGPQFHELGLVALQPGVSAAEFLATFRPRPEPGTLQGRLLGGVGSLSADQQARWPVTLTPGAYVLLCFVPDAEDGRFHLAHGMIRDFSIPE